MYSATGSAYTNPDVRNTAHRTLQWVETAPFYNTAFPRPGHFLLFLLFFSLLLFFHKVLMICVFILESLGNRSFLLCLRNKIGISKSTHWQVSCAHDIHIGPQDRGENEGKTLTQKRRTQKTLLIYECNTWKVLSMQIKAALEQVHFIAPTFLWQVNHIDADTATSG